MKQLLGFLLLVGLVLAYWQLVLALVVLLVVIRLGPRVWGAYQRGQRVRRAELEALAARADQQHAWAMAGDERGVYGAYLPAQMI